MSETTKKKKKWSFANLIFSDAEETTDTESTEEVSEDINVSTTEGDLVQDTGVTPLPISIPLSGDGVFDKKFHEMFEGVIEENNLAGNDYYEFKESVENMASIAGLSEPAKFLAAYATLKSSNDPEFNKVKLMSSIDHYKDILKQEETEFNGAMAIETENKVNAPRTQASQLIDKNQEIVQQIQNLNEQIVKNSNDALALNQDAQNNEFKINQTNKNFIATLAGVISKLDTDKQKIEDLIQETTPPKA